MALREANYYLDTSALVKRYVDEAGSDTIDSIYTQCYQGNSIISLSYWNIGEAAVVFDKYERRIGVNARRLLRDLLREVKTLAKLRRVILVDVSPTLLRKSIKLSLEYHIYIADSLQIASARKANATFFTTGDKELAKIAGIEGLKPLYVGDAQETQ